MNTEAGTPPSEPTSPPREPAPDSDPVIRGVVSGNRVVEDWIRQAQHAARLLGGSSGTAGWADASGRMLKTTSDVITAWSAMLGIAAPNGSGNGGERHSRDGAPAPAAATTSVPSTSVQVAPSPETRRPTPPRVTLNVTSRRQVAVTVDLHKDTAAPLHVLDLRPERGNARRIRGTELTATEAEGLRLRLVVPDTQAAGTYHAVVVDDAADCAVGTITVRIF
jgi:hypothetical protein